MARINLKQLEAFVQVAQLQSFRRAAEKLNTTQPNISAHITKLEALIDTQLMHRDAGSVRLTSAGETLLPQAQAVLKSLDKLIVTSKNTALFEGVLRLGITEIIAHTWLGTFLTHFNERFPNINVELTVDLSANLSEQLNNHAIDIAFQSGPFDQPSTATQTLSSYNFIWVAAPSLGLPNKALTISQLTAQPIVTHARNTRPFQQIQQHLLQNQQPLARFVTSTNIAACMQMAMAGLGIACLPYTMVKGAITDQSLMVLDYDWQPEDLQFYARYHDQTAPTYIQQAADIAQKIAQTE